MRGNELITTPAVANTAETKTEPQPALADNVSVYKIGHTTYKVRIFFDLECKETLEDVVQRLIIKDIDSLAALQV